MKLTRGEPFPYDTGVATNIYTYRQESYFIKKTDTLVSSLINEVDSLRAQLAMVRKLYQLEEEKNKVAAAHIKQQDENFTSLTTTYNQLNKEAQKPKHKWIWFGAGFAGAVILRSFTTR